MSGQAIYLSEEIYHQKLRPLARQVEKYLYKDITIQSEFHSMYMAAITGGMRFRPILQFLGYFLGGGDNPQENIPFGATLELIHKASLIHDDLIDGDSLRRGRPSFYSRFGPITAVAMGDYLVALAFDLLQKLKPTAKYWQSFHKMHLNLCAGELLEVTKMGTSVTLDEATEIALGKTASLIQFALSSGAILANASEEIVTALDLYGQKLGLVFQTVNDLNNLSGVDKNIKGADLTDLYRRRCSLPLASLDRLCQEKEGRGLWDKISSLKESELSEYLTTLQLSAKKGELKTQVATFCKQELERAKQFLAFLPSSKFKEMLMIISDDFLATWFWISERKQS